MEVQVILRLARHVDANTRELPFALTRNTARCHRGVATMHYDEATDSFEVELDPRTIRVLESSADGVEAKRAIVAKAQRAVLGMI